MPHIHEKYDFVISVFIIYENKVLLVHHPRYDKWLPMGGHIELDEDPEEALYREVKEETGLEVELLDKAPSIKNLDSKIVAAPRYIDVHDANPPHKHIALVYFAKSKTSQYKLSNEHTSINWVALNDLDKEEYHLSSSVKFYAKKAIKAAT